MTVRRTPSDWGTLNSYHTPLNCHCACAGANANSSISPIEVAPFLFRDNPLSNADATKPNLYLYVKAAFDDGNVIPCMFSSSGAHASLSQATPVSVASLVFKNFQQTPYIFPNPSGDAFSFSTPLQQEHFRKISGPPASPSLHLPEPVRDHQRTVSCNIQRTVMATIATTTMVSRARSFDQELSLLACTAE